MASNARAIRAGRAFVELFADDTILVRGLRRAEKRLRAFGQSVQRLGLRIAAASAAVMTALFGAAKSFASMGDRIAKMARRTGLSVEALSELEFAASQSGVQLEVLEAGLRRMQRSIYDAERGLSTATDALHELGLSVSALNGLAPEDQFKLLAERISRIEDPTKRAALAMSLFGRGGTALLPLFERGAAGIEELQAKARELGLTMSGEDARAAEVLTDTLDRLWRVVRMGVFRIGAALAPAIKELSERITRITKRVSDWVNRNRHLVVSVAKLAAMALAGGLAIAALGTILVGLAKGIAFLATTISVAMAVFKALAAVIAFLATPVGLVVAAVAALGGVILYVTGAGGRALSWLGDRFRALAERARETFGGIGDALAAGEIGLAARILWLGLKMEWARGVNALEALWLGFRNFFIRIGHDTWTGLLAAVQIVWNAIENGWIDTVAYLGSAWSRFTSFFSVSWERMKAIAARAWEWIKGLFSRSAREGRQEAYTRINRERDAAIERLDSQRDQDLARREAERERRREAAARLHEATLAQLGMENLAKHQELDAEYERRMAENEADLDAARREWQDAIEEARQRRQARDLEGAPDDIESRLGRAFEDMGDLLSDQVAKINARGTFVAANVLGLQAGDATDRMAGGIEKIERNTRPLRNAETLSFA